MSPLVKLAGFDEAVERHRWDGTRAIQRYEGERHCSVCSYGQIVTMATGVQGALFYHGGYGAAERKTVDVCLACGRVKVRGFETLNPRWH